MATHRFEVALAMVCGGNFTSIVQHWSIDDPTGAPNAFQLARDLALSYGPDSLADSFFDVMSILSADSFISSIRARQLAPTGGQQFATVFEPAEYPGTQANDVDAASVAACVVWVTDGGASLNGRTFFPGVPDGALVGGRFTDAYKAEVIAVGNAMLDGIASAAGYGNYEMVLQSGTSPSFAYNAIVHGYISPTPGTQRRRLVPL